MFGLPVTTAWDLAIQGGAWTKRMNIETCQWLHQDQRRIGNMYGMTRAPTPNELHQYQRLQPDQTPAIVVDVITDDPLVQLARVPIIDTTYPPAPSTSARGCNRCLKTCVPGDIASSEPGSGVDKRVQSLASDSSDTDDESECSDAHHRVHRTHHSDIE